jgi:circadian clock protein KaiB
LRLYVRGGSDLTAPAIENVRAICETHLSGEHLLEIIDLDEQPDRAADEQIIALPTLVRLAPAPVRRLIGDLSDQNRVAVALNLRGFIA